MKRLILILFCTLAMGSSEAWAMPDVATTVQRVESTATATGGVGHITFATTGSDAVFHIYSITGQLLKTVRLNADAHTTIEMPKGFYVVKCSSQWSRKVIVR
ncbi:T9SS type A sorting domain-containing protein [Sodaliphilus sp.]|uniref:T9SS type A sorting domain-containing protein n=1 Tax=Sodaliphilus sp. TaxID=2815818 RepID=UPI00388FBEBD